MAAAASRGLALSLLLLAALAGCAADQPVLTLVFEHVPPDTQQIEVTLHGRDATFMGPDAGNDQVGVRYASGNVVIAIEAAYAAARGNHIRLPLTAGAEVVLDGTATATATGGGEPKTVETSVSVMARGSATMTFDFGSTDGGTDASADDADAGAIDGHADADADVDANEAGAGDVAMDLARDVPAEMPGTDVAPDKPPADVAADMPSPTDTSIDVPIGTSCTLRGQWAASIGTGGSGPTVAYAAPLFGVAWKAAAMDLLYNAVSDTGTRQLGIDKTLVSGTAQGVNTPRLARVGTDFALAYGRYDGSGAQAARGAGRTGDRGRDRASRAGDEAAGCRRFAGDRRHRGQRRPEKRCCDQPGRGSLQPDRGDRRRVQRRFHLRHRQDAGGPRGDADDRNRVGARSFPCRRRHPGDVRGRDIAGIVGRHEPDGRRDVHLHVG